MQISPSILASTAACLACIVYPASAQTSCVPGAQCRVDDGTTETRANENFTTSTSGMTDAALVADNHSTIHGSQLNITASGTDFYGAYVRMGGSLVLQNSDITGYYGVRLEGGLFAPSFSMTGGSITASEQALWMGTDTVATLAGVTINSSGTDEAINVQAVNATLSITGGSITAPNAYTAISFGSGNTLNLSNVDITGGTGRAISSTGPGSVMNMLGGTVTYAGNQIAVDVTGTNVIDGTKIVSAARGVELMDGGASSTLLARNVEIQTNLTTGNDAVGLVVSGDSAATVENSSIRTQGNDNATYGIWVIDLSNSAASLHAQETTIETFGNGSAHGIVNQGGTATLKDVSITTHGSGAYGLYSEADLAPTADTTMTGGSITVHAANSIGAWALFGGNIVLDDVKVNALNDGRGVLVYPNSTIEIRNKSVITASGANAIGLYFIGATAPNTIKVDDSTVASGLVGVYARGGDDLLDVKRSTILGERLVHATACTPSNNCPTGSFASNLNFRAQDSQLFGHASVAPESRLWMNFSQGGNIWTIRPTTAGVVQSDISEITLGGANQIMFDPNGTAQWQTLVVGSGTPSGSTVYTVLPGATPHITLNTRLNAGGAGNQFTDRLLVNGDVTGGTTWVQINAASGSPGGWTSPNADFLATEGISLVQVAGTVSADAFALAGGYTTLGATPYSYTLHAYGPGSSHGAADAGERLVAGTNPYWDWRLQSAPANPFLGTGAAPALVPQAATYLAAPTALFQMGLLDIGSLHRRLGEAHRGTTVGAARTAAAIRPVQLASAQAVSGLNLRDAAIPVRDEVFLRTYGGDYRYTSNLTQGDYGVDADLRYAAIQGGGSIYGIDTARHRLRFGLAASVGTMTFAPRFITDSQKTRVRSWSISPTFTWQNAAGAYVDAIVSLGRFMGDVATATLGKTATLRGQSLAASVETGVQIPVGSVTLEPQAQAVYQHLKFKRTWAHDLGGGFPVNMGKLDQWTLRAGGLVRANLATGDRDAQVYAKAHVAHTLGGGQKVWLGDDFRVGKTGTVLETGLGLDAAVAGGATRIYGDIIRTNRLGRAGNQGWALNLGVRVLF